MLMLAPSQGSGQRALRARWADRILCGQPQPLKSPPALGGLAPAGPTGPSGPPKTSGEYATQGPRASTAQSPVLSR